MKKIIFILSIIIFIKCSVNESTNKSMSISRFTHLKNRMELQADNEILLACGEYIYRGIYEKNILSKGKNKLILKKGYIKTNTSENISEIGDEEVEIDIKKILAIDKTLKDKFLKEKIQKIKKIKKLNKQLHLPLIRKCCKDENIFYDIEDIPDSVEVILENTLVDRIKDNFIVLNKFNNEEFILPICYNNLLLGQNLNIKLKTTILEKDIKNFELLLLHGYLRELTNNGTLINICKIYLVKFLKYDKDLIIKVLRHIIEKKKYTYKYGVDKEAYFNLLSYYITLTYDDPTIDWEIELMRVIFDKIDCCNSYFSFKTLYKRGSNLSKGDLNKNTEDYNFIKISKTDHQFNEPFNDVKFKHFNFEVLNPEEIISIRIFYDKQKKIYWSSPFNRSSVFT